jgi:hypothetical protein
MFSFWGGFDYSIFIYSLERHAFCSLHAVFYLYECMVELDASMSFTSQLWKMSITDTINALYFQCLFKGFMQSVYVLLACIFHLVLQLILDMEIV